MICEKFAYYPQYTLYFFQIWEWNKNGKSDFPLITYTNSDEVGQCTMFPGAHETFAGWSTLQTDATDCHLVVQQGRMDSLQSCRTAYASSPTLFFKAFLMQPRSFLDTQCSTRGSEEKQEEPRSYADVITSAHLHFITTNHRSRSSKGHCRPGEFGKQCVMIWWICSTSGSPSIKY